MVTGEVSLFNVWATWCVSCRVEHEVLVQLARTGQVDIYGLNWKDDRAGAQQWLRQLGDPYVANAFDKEGRMAIDLGVYAAPESFLVDANGKIIFKQIGAVTPDVIENEILPRNRP